MSPEKPQFSHLKPPSISQRLGSESSLTKGKQNKYTPSKCGSFTHRISTMSILITHPSLTHTLRTQPAPLLTMPKNLKNPTHCDSVSIGSVASLGIVMSGGPFVLGSVVLPNRLSI